MTPADIHIAADQFHEDSKTRARLHALANVVEAAKADHFYADNAPTHPDCDVCRALAGVEALQP